MPAKSNVFKRFKDTAVQKVNKFLYGERDTGYGYGSGAVYDAGEPPYEPEQAPRRRRSQYREERYEQQAQEEQLNYQQPPQGYQQQMPYQPQQGYGYQQPPQGYQPQQQQAYQPPMTQFAAQVEDQRARNPQQQMPQQDPQKVVPFPGSYNGEQPQEVKPASVRVITVRGFNDCRSAIAYLRAGEILLVVMDGIQDQAEMRRYVDMMAGACFSLSASITKVSRYGSYLAAPGQVSVWADPVISQMNGSARRNTRPSYQGQAQNGYRPYAGEPGQQQNYQPYGYQDGQQPYAAQQSGYGQAADGGEFYARQPQTVPEQPPFEAQERGAGYTPDHEAEAL